jgi:recombination protein RecT
MNESVSPGRQVAAILESKEFTAKIKQALPEGLSLDRFTRATITAIQKNPAIVEGDKHSLYSSIAEAAAAGLHLDGKEAALVIYNTNVGSQDKPRWIKKVQYMPMIAGLIKNLGRAGVKVDSQVVYRNDVFVVDFGDSPSIDHSPPRFGEDRGEMIGAYAICTDRDGFKYREVMDKAQIEAVRKQSKAQNSLMWTQFASEAWRKTVLRRCAKRIPVIDPILKQTLDDDDRTFEMADSDIPDHDPATVVSEQEVKPAAPVQANGTRRPKALAAVVEQHKADEAPPPADDPPQEEEEIF